MASHSNYLKLKRIPLHLNITPNYNPITHCISASSHSSTYHNHSSPEGSMMKSTSAPSEHSTTSSSRQFAPISPTYRTYHPEWTSVSPPALASSFNDHPEFYSAPPRKKLCHLLNPTFLSSSTSSVRDFPEPHTSSTPTNVTTKSNPKSVTPTYSNDLRSPNQISHQASCSVSPNDARSPCNIQFSDDHEHEIFKHSTLTRHQPMQMDEDRNLSSRPLKNTKRAAQNRAAQRAFRERKDRYVRELEARSTQFEEYILRYGLLEERERLIEAREAKLTGRNGTTGSIQQSVSKEKLPASVGIEGSYGTKAGGNDKKDYVAQLEDQLDNCRMEITRLRSELLKFNDQDEEMDKVNSRASIWERGPDCIPARTGSASDVDTVGPTSCSPDSPYGWSTSKALPEAHHHTEWVRNDRIAGDNDHKSCRTVHSVNGFHDHRNPTLTATIHNKAENIQSEESSKFGWSDGSRSPVSLSLLQQIKHSGRVRNSSEECDRMSHHQLPIPKLVCHDVPLHRANILDRQGKLVRLPAIHHHLNQSWRDDGWKK